MINLILAAYVHIFWVRPAEWTKTRVKVDSAITDVGTATDKKVTNLNTEQSYCFSVQHYTTTAETAWSTPICHTVKKKELIPSVTKLLSAAE